MEWWIYDGAKCVLKLNDKDIATFRTKLDAKIFSKLFKIPAYHEAERSQDVNIVEKVDEHKQDTTRKFGKCASCGKQRTLQVASFALSDGKVEYRCRKCL